MKKSLLLLASLALGTSAFAQTMPSQGTTPDATAPMPATPDAAMQAPAPTSSAMPAPATTSTPDAAAAPAAAMPAADDSNLPMCSRTVTDKCKQHEGGMHKMSHKKK